MGRLPWPGILLQPEGMWQKWTLIWACFYPPGVLKRPGFSQAFPLLQGGKWDLGDGPRPGVERRDPAPTWRTEQEACATAGAWEKQGPGLCLGSLLLAPGPPVECSPRGRGGDSAGSLRGRGWRTSVQGSWGPKAGDMLDGEDQGSEDNSSFQGTLSVFEFPPTDLECPSL